MIKDDMVRKILSGIYHEGEYGIEIEPLDKATYNSCNVKCN